MPGWWVQVPRLSLPAEGAAWELCTFSQPSRVRLIAAILPDCWDLHAILESMWGTIWGRLWFVDTCASCYKPLPFSLFLAALPWYNHTYILSVLVCQDKQGFLTLSPKAKDLDLHLLFFPWEKSWAGGISPGSEFCWSQGGVVQSETAPFTLFNMDFLWILCSTGVLVPSTELQNSHKGIFVCRWWPSQCFCGGDKGWDRLSCHLTDITSLLHLLL